MCLSWREILFVLLKLHSFSAAPSKRPRISGSNSFGLVNKQQSDGAKSRSQLGGHLGPRFLTNDGLSLENLITLCATCHTRVNGR